MGNDQLPKLPKTPSEDRLVPARVCLHLSLVLLLELALGHSAPPQRSIGLLATGYGNGVLPSQKWRAG